ncbi:MAG: hypothetical protein LBK53_08155 [Heliobacteriaceae bacterium]|jgi:hypothetical protein|nr:hypothetical protein [Heliobacteriaceae bacterium]
MPMNVNTQFRLGIDTTVLKEVSQEILKRAAEKNSQYSNSVFNPADIGTDLYKGSVDNNTARQIAMNNSGLQVQLNQNVLETIKFLNSQAAQNIHKSVGGKITIAVNEAPAETLIAEAPQFNHLISLAAGKDKHGSNPKYHGELLNLEKEEKPEEVKNIFGIIP